MELVNLQKLRGKSTYLSQIWEAEDPSGKKYIIKRNKGKLTEVQFRFLEWVMEENPSGLLVPLEFSGKVDEKWDEIYELIDLPLLDDILFGLFPLDEKPKYGWNFSHAQGIMEQITATLGMLHSRGFIHHDVRSRNIFLNPHGLEVKLFDYNSLREPYFLKEGKDSWNDVPPEYRKGGCPIDFRFDVYQAGRLFFEMTHGDTEGYSKKVPRIEISDAVLEVIAKASHDRSIERYADCKEFHQAICSLHK